MNIQWDKMDIQELEKSQSCFFTELRSLQDAEKSFGPIKIEQEWRGIPTSPHQQFRSVQFEVASKKKKNEAPSIDGLALDLKTPFTVSLKALREHFGQESKLPQVHYNSPISYSFSIKKYGKAQMILQSDPHSAGDSLDVEQIILRRFRD